MIQVWKKSLTRLILIQLPQSRQRMSRGFRHKIYGRGLGTMLASGRKSVKDGSRIISQKSTLVPSSLCLPENGVLTFATPELPKNWFLKWSWQRLIIFLRIRVRNECCDSSANLAATSSSQSSCTYAYLQDSVGILITWLFVHISDRIE